MVSHISTYATTLWQNSVNMNLQSQISTTSQEATTGTYQDPALQLGAGISALYTLQVKSTQENTLASTTTAVSNKLDTMQTALTSINSLVSTLTSDALDADSSNGQTAVQYTTVATQASSALDQLMTLMNTSYNGQYVFSGTDSGTQTMASSFSSGTASTALSTLLSNAVTANGGTALDSSTVSALQSSIDDMFTDSNADASLNFSGTFYTASTSATGVTVSTGGTSTMTYTMLGDSDAFKSIIKGLSILSQLGSSDLDTSAKQTLLYSAIDSLQSGQTSLTTDTALLGAKQTQIQNIADAQSDAVTSTQQHISNLVGVNTATAATQLTALQNQLEDSYTITSTLSKMSILNYVSF